MRKMRMVPLTPEKQGSEEMPQSENAESAENIKLRGLKSADRKRGRRKGVTSKNVKKCQKYFRHFSTFFAQGKKSSKIVKKCQKYFRHFSTFFARHQVSGQSPKLISARIHVALVFALAKILLRNHCPHLPISWGIHLDANTCRRCKYMPRLYSHPSRKILANYSCIGSCRGGSMSLFFRICPSLQLHCIIGFELV